MARRSAHQIFQPPKMRLALAFVQGSEALRPCSLGSGKSSVLAVGGVGRQTASADVLHAQLAQRDVALAPDPRGRHAVRQVGEEDEAGEGDGQRDDEVGDEEPAPAEGGRAASERSATWREIWHMWEELTHPASP